MKTLAKTKELFGDLRVAQPWIAHGHTIKLPSTRCPWTTRSCEIILAIYGTLNIDKLFASEWAIGAAEQGFKFERYLKSKLPRIPEEMLLEKAKSMRSSRGDVRLTPCSCAPCQCHAHRLIPRLVPCHQKTYAGALHIPLADLTDRLKRKIEAGMKICTVVPEALSLRSDLFLENERKRIRAAYELHKERQMVHLDGDASPPPSPRSSAAAMREPHVRAP